MPVSVKATKEHESAKSFVQDRAFPSRRLQVGIVSAVVAYAAFQVLAYSPELSEWVLGEGRGTIPARLIGSLTGSVPFSVAEVLTATYLGWWVALAGAAFRAVLRRRRRFWNAALGGLTRLVRDGGILIALGYLVWGFNYARIPLDRRAGWPAWGGTSTEELAVLAAQAVSRTNDAYRALHGSDDAGAPTRVGPVFGASLDSTEIGWARVATVLPENARAVTGSFGPVKRPLVSGLLARLGISGVYMPLTAEPHVLRGMPAVGAAQAMAHEQAHQRGFANEAEASFMGFLANSLSDGGVARYSSSVFAARQLLAALGRTDPDAGRDISGRLVAGVRRDLDDLAEFWEPYRGVGQRVGSAVNDRYLRANRVAGGVASYNRSVRLLVALYRQTGSLVPAAD